MRLTLDTEARTMTLAEDGRERTIDLYSPEAFEALSRQWLRVGWSARYPYTFTWLGRPIIQIPEDMIRAQEVLYRVQPDVIVETGVAHGGSLIYYASLCQLFGKGRVIGVDIEIRPPNRAAIEAHDQSGRITLIEGSSVDPDIVRRVASEIRPGETVLVFLDSAHGRAHVAAELEAYAPLVSAGSWIVATDGIMRDLADVPRGDPRWTTDNPYEAARDFAARHPEFVLEQPEWPFHDSPLRHNVTHWPGAWLRRVS